MTRRYLPTWSSTDAKLAEGSALFSRKAALPCCRKIPPPLPSNNFLSSLPPKNFSCCISRQRLIGTFTYHNAGSTLICCSSAETMPTGLHASLGSHLGTGKCSALHASNVYDLRQFLLTWFSIRPDVNMRHRRSPRSLNSTARKAQT